MTYVYKEALGNVTVHYRMSPVTSCKTIYSPSGASTNTPYDTEEHRKTTIVTSDKEDLSISGFPTSSNEKERSLKDDPSDVRL